jgi:putative transposase
MPEYRRAWIPGGTYFFTVNLLRRRENPLLVRHIDALRRTVAQVRKRHPFIVHGWVVLPDHLHCILELPPGDSDFAMRWSLIKQGFSKSIPNTEHLSEARARRGERGIRQRRFWEHVIRDEADYRSHMDYIHLNPVKHGLVAHARDWPYSTFHRLVEEGVYPPDWMGVDDFDGVYGE